MKQRRTTLGLAIAAGLLGTGHLALTPLLYTGWTIDSLWFVGTGLAMLIGAGANLLAVGGGNRMRRAGLLSINLAMAAFFASAWPVLPEPQVVVGGVLFAALAACAALFSDKAPEQGKQNAW
ncbi:MAG TPA: hypothetical protein VEZ70_09925 [Allosphingosinicella sp.]|nr:hypothetical protein [Allosphingosinicella sp.]